MFKIHDGALTINGSFLTEAHVIARFAPQRSSTASFWASELDQSNSGWTVINGTCVGRPFKFGNRGHKECFDLKMSMGYSSATFAFRNWTVKVHGMRSVPRAEDHVAGPKHRLDIGFSARGDAPSRDRPHGIIGQSYATPGLVRHGNEDKYPLAPRRRAPSRARCRITRWRASTRPSLPFRGSTPQRTNPHHVTARMPTWWWTRRRSIASRTPSSRRSAGVCPRRPVRLQRLPAPLSRHRPRHRHAPGARQPFASPEPSRSSI